MRTLDRLGPIDLDGLNRQAALLTRVDRKYLVPRSVADDLVHELADRALALEIGGVRRFGYRSVYLDTPALASYHGAAQPRRRRFKVRIRSYLDSGERFVEVKTRGRRGVTAKERRPAAHSDALDAAGHAYVREVLADAGIDTTDVDDLAPSLVTRYDRSTLFIPASAGRMTIDTSVSWRLPDGAGFASPGLTIVETKSGGSASDADRLLWSMKQRPRTVSKYATGLAVLRPDLPSNRWRPVMRRHFTTLDHTTEQENVTC